MSAPAKPQRRRPLGAADWVESFLLSPRQKAVALALVPRLAQEIEPQNLDTIALRLGLSEAAVRRTVADLKRLGVVRTHTETVTYTWVDLNLDDEGEQLSVWAKEQRQSRRAVS